MSFTDLKLSPPLLRAVEHNRFDVPTEIQRRTIPIILSGCDLMASAQTGTGKTAAFVLPILQLLMTKACKPGRGPRVLVLAPTRELATQVTEDIRMLSRFCRATYGTIIGGVSYGPQERLLSRPSDFLVATPGRLMDHLQSGRVEFSRLEILVLDEADRMWDMGCIDAVRKIVAATPADRQTLLFSATLEGKVLHIAEAILKRPQRIQLHAVRDRHALIRQWIHRADDSAHKRRLLEHHLQSKSLTQALVFTATKRRADKLAAALLKEGHRTAALHGDIRQARRQRTLNDLRRGMLRFLVATDVAARGLDIKGMSHVINFDLPMVAEDYIHRIGRTGRAGADGIAISLVGPEDIDRMAEIERITGQKLNREIVPGLEPQSTDQDGCPGGYGQTTRAGKSDRRQRNGSASNPRRGHQSSWRSRRTGRGEAQEGRWRAPRRASVERASHIAV